MAKAAADADASPGRGLYHGHGGDNDKRRDRQHNTDSTDSVCNTSLHTNQTRHALTLAVQRSEKVIPYGDGPATSRSALGDTYAISSASTLQLLSQKFNMSNLLFKCSIILCLQATLEVPSITRG